MLVAMHMLLHESTTTASKALSTVPSKAASNDCGLSRIPLTLASAAWRHCDERHWPQVRELLETDFALRVEDGPAPMSNLCLVYVPSQCESYERATHLQRQLLDESRGTVFEKSTGRCVCLGLRKFWNHGERHAADIDWKSAVAAEKVDGCVFKLFYYDGKWRLASNRHLDLSGKAHSDKYACTGRTNLELFQEAAENSALDYSRLDQRYVYVLERVHPDFVIVLVPDRPQLFHLATRDMQTLKELDHVDIGVLRPREWRVRSLLEARRLLDGLPGDHEGLVVRDAAFRRIKIKRGDYVIRHLSTNGDHPDYSWCARSAPSAASTMPVDRLCLNVWLRNEASEFICYFPEHRARYHAIAAVLESSAFADEGWIPANPRERYGVLFLHEERLWFALSLLAV